MLLSLTASNLPETTLPLPGTTPTGGGSIRRATSRLATLATMITRRRLAGMVTLGRLPRRRGTSETILPLRLSGLLEIMMTTGCGALRPHRLLAWTLGATILRGNLFRLLATLVVILPLLLETTMTAMTAGAGLRPPKDTVLTRRLLSDLAHLLGRLPPVLVTTTTARLLGMCLESCLLSGADAPPQRVSGGSRPTGVSPSCSLWRLPSPSCWERRISLPVRTAIRNSPAAVDLTSFSPPCSRRSQSPPPRASPGGPYDSAGYGAGSTGAAYNGSSGYAGNGYSAGGAPSSARGSGGNRDYAQPRAREAEPASSYRRA